MEKPRAIEALKKKVAILQTKNEEIEIERTAELKEHELNGSMVREMDTFLRRYEHQVEQNDLIIKSLQEQQDNLKTRLVWQTKPFDEERKELKQKIATLISEKREILEDFKKKCIERDISYERYNCSINITAASS